MAPPVVICCCSQSISRLDELHIKTLYSSSFDCKEWFNELLLPFYHLEPVGLFLSDIFWPYLINCDFLNILSFQAIQTQPCHFQSYLNFRSSKFWCSVWILASHMFLSLPDLLFVSTNSGIGMSNKLWMYATDITSQQYHYLLIPNTLCPHLCC